MKVGGVTSSLAEGLVRWGGERGEGGCFAGGRHICKESKAS